MCFTEFLGYTCGHTSIPVKRPCPMTTQSHVNPICPLPACRPLLAFTMCPSCARIVHGRWVNIIVHEHEFMHARGACHCPLRFPHLQQPRVVSQYEDAEDMKDISQEAFAARFRARERSATMTSQTSAATDGQSSGSDSSSPTVILAPIVKQEPPSSPRESFHFSPSAAEFTPSTTAAVSPHIPHGPLPSINEIFGMPADFDFGMAGLDLGANASFGRSSAGPSEFEPHGRPAGNMGKNKGKGESKGKGMESKGKDKEVAVKKEEPGDLSYHPHHFNNDCFHPQQYVRGESVASSATLASSATATSGGSHFPPMYETREGPDSKIAVTTRMMSQYGAEWIAEHSERHQNGQCNCRCSFDKYPAQYAHMLDELMPEDIANEMMNNDFSDFSFSYEYAPKQEEHEDTSFGIHKSQSNDDLQYGTPGFHSDGYVPAPTNTPAEASTQQPYQYSGNFDEELSQAMRHHFPSVSSVPTPSMHGPTPVLPMPAPTQSPYDADAWKFHIPPDHTTPSFPRGHQPSSFGEPARWACAPPNLSHTNDGSTHGDTMPIPRPVDMQVIAYNVNDVPIVGLPIGAGPEGDSHMPPFEDCELYYPKIHDHRPATF
ncbi:uncharacterized protein F4807DRAFT_105697 [Annulohypoxylon truncatum]|uniref:uncharacterized protein n=1 Tax=Annulohypoxylon truncatum TaxID=327061 RepID=UPI002008D8EA|nr:uncharacterized protein F4807DRAFT_105697 [Annulohypoxylon truncatum]KAI1208972.1 hypothetical protein F4807DRAFT_105697 [Annulohypoxylon truncatum]